MHNVVCRCLSELFRDYSEFAIFILAVTAPIFSYHSSINFLNHFWYLLSTSKGFRFVQDWKPSYRPWPTHLSTFTARWIQDSQSRKKIFPGLFFDCLIQPASLALPWGWCKSGQSYSWVIWALASHSKLRTPDAGCPLDTWGPLIISETRLAKEPTPFLGTTENTCPADRASLKPMQ